MNFIKNNIVGFLIFTVFAVFTIFSYKAQERFLASYTCDSKPIIVQGNTDGSHQTLYGIAHGNCQGNVSEAVNDLVDTYGVDIQVGQQIFLPANNDCNLRLTDGGDVFEDC